MRELFEMADARRRSEWSQTAEILFKMHLAWFTGGDDDLTSLDFNPTLTAAERREARRPTEFISLAQLGASLGLKVKPASKEGASNDERN